MTPIVRLTRAFAYNAILRSSKRWRLIFSTESFCRSVRSLVRRLRALQRQHAAGDSSVYPLLYSQGATFWFEIDRALQARNGQGLDELVPGLIHGSFEANDGLPESFTEELRERLGPDARSILDRYY
jgi:hypothetical protein